MPDRPPFFAGVDWGTTRLRIWLMDDTGAVLAERRADRGLLSAANEGFAEVLESELGAMGAPAEIPAMICGMAGSKQGWVEVPYVDTPVSLDRLGEGATKVQGIRRAAFILPGVAQSSGGREDVMRGEETQIAGAAASLSGGSQLVCLPGTHSKWARIDRGALTGFETYMTGEVFAVACEHSILRHSVGAMREVSPENPVFRQSLRDSIGRPGAVLARMFSVRAAGLLAGLDQADAAAALSGHLIGSEVGAALENNLQPGCSVLLVASGHIAPLYEEALRQSGASWSTQDADEAVRDGLCQAARLHLS